MIVRILEDGQYSLDADVIGRLESLDSELDETLHADNEQRFVTVLAEILDTVRSSGTRLDDETLRSSDLVLPSADATIDEVRALLIKGLPDNLGDTLDRDNE